MPERYHTIAVLFVGRKNWMVLRYNERFSSDYLEQIAEGFEDSDTVVSAVVSYAKEHTHD